MRQGEIWYVDLNPVKRSEQTGMRLVVIISGNLLNEYLNTVICFPLTTKIKNYKGNVILEPDKLNKLKSRSEILIAHIRSISKERLVKKVGMISNEDITRLKNGLNEILRY